MKAYLIFKCCCDFIVSLVAGLVFLPFFLIISIIVKIDSQGPVLLKQKRVGKGKKLFVIYKFRTMRIDTPQNVPTNQLDSAKYITRVGKVLRKTSLDELPQLINILKGNMSIIGPRPVLAIETHLLDLRDQNGANNLRPGLTGWAQVNGRDELTSDVKAAYDGEYAQNISLRFDLKVLLRSIACVLSGKGNTDAVNVKEADVTAKSTKKSSEFNSVIDTEKE